MGSSFRLSSIVCRGKSRKNILFSPAAVKICLALAYLGAEGNTAEEIKQFMDLKGDNKDTTMDYIFLFLKKINSEPVPITIVSRIYLNSRFKINPSFNEIATRSLDTQAENVNFNDNMTAVQKINNWVEFKTEQRIKNLILSTNIDICTDCVLVSATYFKGEWKNRFDIQSTEKRHFTLNKFRRVTVNMMFQIDEFRFGRLNELDAYGIELPYKSPNISMLVLLPKAVDGLAALESNLKVYDLPKLRGKLKFERVHLGFPKFQYECDISLQPALEELGIKTMFSKNADFSKLLAIKSELFVSEVKQKVFITVDEIGTEVTTTKDLNGNSQSSFFDVRDLIVDHPFFFAIADKDNVYFAGHVADMKDL